MMTTEKVSGTSTAKPASKLMKGWNTPIVLLSMFIGYLLYRNATYAKDPIMYMIPNFLMYTPFRELVPKVWELMITYPDKIYEPKQIPEIQAEDFSIERLREATNNWRTPAVVRGLFSNSTATTQWLEPGYVNSYIGKHYVPINKKNVHWKGQQNRSWVKVGEVWDELLTDSKSTKYLFFPVKSYQVSNHSASILYNELVEKVNEMVQKDLDLDRIWKGFGTKSHKSFLGTQIIAGHGNKDPNATTGSGFHCAMGNNWFIQVLGRKEWVFVDQKDSAWMMPTRGGAYNMITGAKTKMAYLMHHIPTLKTDLHPGDMLYNPDWMWHTVRNYEGLSIGCPIREGNASLSYQNNFQYASIVTINHILGKFGLAYGLQPVNTTWD